MQSGYGEMQQFMVDASLFSSPSNAPPPPQPPIPSDIHHHMFSHPPPHFAHFGHPVPITQQLFQHQQAHHHQFHQLFHHSHQQQQQQQQQQHMRLEQGLEPENPRGPASFLAAMNFKLGVSESSGGGGGVSRDHNGLNDDDGILHGGEDDGSDESRLHHHHHPWHRDDDESAPSNKQPFWRPLDIGFINPNNKRPSKDKQSELDITSNIKHFKKSNEVLDQDANYKPFSELEAIYKPGSTPITGGGGGGGGGAGGGASTNNCNNQTGSGSALTGDDNPLMPVTTPMGPTNTIDNISDTSNGGDAPPPPLVLNKKFQKGSGSGSADRRKKDKRRQQRQLASITTFFESLVKQLMDHQENLHRRFLEVMEKRDQERTSREEAWRKQESAKANHEAMARAQERALAASRESAIIAFLEKIMGESLDLPTNSQLHHQSNEKHDANLDINNNRSSEVEKHKGPADNNNAGHDNYTIVSTPSGSPAPGSSRWPKAEVLALIRVRSGFESRFQEPGLKGPLWEEVSLAMSSLGYSRNAKRCKEKWENINKYFRKAKDSGKKRPQHSKTCPYFQQLDQLYSSKSSNANSANEEQKESTNSELLDAIVVSNDVEKRNVNREFNDATTNEADGDDEDEDVEEGQGESQELEQAQGQENLNNRDESAHFLMNNQ